MQAERLRQQHVFSLRISDLQQRIYADYQVYVAEQDAFILKNRNSPYEFSDTFPCGEADIIRSFEAYQKRRDAFLRSPALRSETFRLKTVEEWLTFSEKVHYTFSLYLWNRNHERITVRHFVNAHSIFALP